MIVFIAPNPNKVKEREGFLQRVAAIDEIFSNEEKIYYEDIEDIEDLASRITKADMVYVHSLYFAEKMLLSFPMLKEKIVTDLHGVVPEEENFAGNTEKGKAMAKVEEIVFRHGKYFVAVSQAMVDHFTNKYSLTTRVKWVVLPIFNVSIQPDVRKKKITENVIYAGGAQKWQNIDLMVDAINTSSTSYIYTILTHSPDAFKNINGVAREKVTIKTVDSSKVQDYYKKSSLGFVLRDDIVINRVACPTKLIEYLSAGVVPIVLSPNIGDFQRFGYRYFTLKDFLEGHADRASIDDAMRQNLVVFSKLEEQTNIGTKSLTSLYDSIKNHSRKVIKNIDKEYLIAIIKVGRYQDKIADYEQQINHEAKIIKDYADAVEYYKNIASDITNSKKWVLISKLTSIKNILKHHKRT